jgi:quercetin dioxygenase-like cupin family protein
MVVHSAPGFAEPFSDILWSATKEAALMIGFGASIDCVRVSSVEGCATNIAFAIKPLVAGDAMSMLEMICPAGLRVPFHTHSHESLLYVVRGAIKTQVGDKSHVLRSGDACRHPKGVPHTVEVLEDCTFIEIKSPTIDFGAIYGRTA